jgi:hypothetical protein
MNLWVDAVCINQEDRHECNSQVALMSFIYTRAQMVVAWLGMAVPSAKAGLIAPEYDGYGRSHLLAESLSGDQEMRYSPSAGSELAFRIAKSAYWTRLWVVQEVCLAYDIVFVYGEKVWNWNQSKWWSELCAEIHQRW